jgi:hypothetical protein
MVTVVGWLLGLQVQLGVVQWILQLPLLLVLLRL